MKTLVIALAALSFSTAVLADSAVGEAKTGEVKASTAKHKKHKKAKKGSGTANLKSVADQRAEHAN